MPISYIPNLNFAVLENIFKISSNFSITLVFDLRKYAPKQRILPQNNLDLAGNVILDENQQENNVKDRNFVLFGVGLQTTEPN
jgi:Fe(3+) dicitrate transport protein